MRDKKYWRVLMESEPGEEIPEPDDIPETPEEAIIMDDLVFPYQLTETMLVDYEDPAHNRENLRDGYGEIMTKLLRSAKYWRIAVPKWLPNRMGKMGIL